MKKIALLLLPLTVLILALKPQREQTITVTGTVTTATGTNFSAAVVKEKQKQASILTEANGKFSIQVSDKNAVLVFAAIGYATQEIALKGRTTVDVVLQAEEAENLASHYQRNYDMSAQVMSTRKVASSPMMHIAPSGVDNLYSQYEVKREEGYVDFNTEGYDYIKENSFLKANDNPLSTFSIDVDAASYSNIRRFLNQGQLPPSGAVRIEEMVNYFQYEYDQPAGDKPFAIHTEISDAPWNNKHKLVLIGLQGKKIPTENLPASNLVFLIDVSGSMWSPNKLPLVKASLKLLTDQLREKDRVSIVVYAGAAGLVLQPTAGDNKTAIKEAIDKLEAGGSTAGGAGIKLAYKTAREQFIKNGNNRVILCSDGDFNVGESSDDAMERLIEAERNAGVFLTVLGYGMGNYKDSKMQKLANKGNGNHAYIDGMSEAKKVLVNEFGGTLFTIAKDVKLQVEFNPAKVQGYRLIGYENRMLAKEDFNDDKKDAGELGSGHTVTALYEIIPVGVNSSFLKDVDKLKYQKNVEAFSKSTYNDEIMTVKFRYKQPDGETSRLMEHSLKDTHKSLSLTSDNFRFAAAVAELGMLLRQSSFKSDASFTNVVKMARNARGIDAEGYRAEFIRLAENAQLLAKETKKTTDKEDVVMRY